MLEKSVFQWYNSRKFPDLWENWNFARRKRRRVLMMGKLQMDREWTEQDLRTFAEGAQAAFETVLLDELPQDTGWQDEGLQVSYSLCNGRVSCVLHRTVRADGKLWRITMSAPLAGNLLPEERMSARERELCREDLNHDFLSGVYNRRYLETVIAAELDRWAEQGRKAAVALVSLDHGAQLRDTYGQPVMDQLICFVANQWKKIFRHPRQPDRLPPDRHHLCGGLSGHGRRPAGRADAEHLRRNAPRVHHLHGHDEAGALYPERRSGRAGRAGQRRQLLAAPVRHL